MQIADPPLPPTTVLELTNDQQRRRSFIELLPLATVEEIIAGGVKSYLGSEAARSRTSGHAIRLYQPDLMAEHNNGYPAFELNAG
ncbi:hypothetical protein [Streptomyces platensis]|uniref:hypothetical protein n=1 Tax=Streptomyces platensis TaxID=58346 RepID=UPI00386AFDCF|nr:hypothetical protein OG962_05960 [Streptomyces platensis]